MSGLYPLKFNPIYKEKIWGGNKIHTVLGKDFAPLKKCGESWELSGVEGNISIIKNGPLKGTSINSLLEKDAGSLLGSAFQREKEFPLLIKFLDANDDLSIQVHPDDQLAKAKHGGRGKTEMWYIIEAEENAKLISGFKEKISKETFLEKCNKGELMEMLNQESAGAGDVFFIPSGRIHSIGKGILLAEIQQTSDTTYRIYDFDRLGDDGKSRSLHIKDAAEALDFNREDSYRTQYDQNANEAVLVNCPYFTTVRLKGKSDFERELSDDASFRIYISLAGNASFLWNDSSTEIIKGEVILMPSCIKNFHLKTESEFLGLEVFIK